MTDTALPLACPSLPEAARAIAAGHLASAALVEACLARAAALEPALHAFAWLDPGRARRLAAAADRRRPALQRRGALPLLHGVPIGVKDILDTAGVPTEHGSAVFAGRVPSRSAAVVRAIERTGAIVFGKTVTAELAYFHPGPTRNPWNLERTPGGSSMGSAAAVAAGIVPAAVGTQTNGSVIRPAAFCGVVGFKPTAGRLPRAGVLTFSKTLDQVGGFARSVEGAAWLAAAMAGEPLGEWWRGPFPDAARDTVTGAAGRGAGAPTRPPHPQGHIRNARNARWRGLPGLPGLTARAPRVPGGSTPHRPAPPPRSAWEPAAARLPTPRFAVARTAEWARLEPAMRERFEADVAALAVAGAQIEEPPLPPGLDDAPAVHRTIMAAEAATAIGPLTAGHTEAVSATLLAFLEEGAQVEPAAYRAALRTRRRLIEAFAAWAAPFEALLTPPAAGEAPGPATTGDPRFCTRWTLVGAPALVLPTGLGPTGLPLGLQLVGSPGADRRLLAAAAWVEARLHAPGGPAFLR